MRQKRTATFWGNILYLAVAWGMTGAVVMLAAWPGESVGWFGFAVAIIGVIVAVVAWVMERRAKKDE